jgi:hypothetical protein
MSKYQKKMCGCSGCNTVSGPVSGQVSGPVQCEWHGFGSNVIYGFKYCKYCKQKICQMCWGFLNDGDRCKECAS